MTIGAEKQFYKPLHSQGFKRTHRGRTQNYTHVYEHSLPKSNAVIAVNLTADQQHVVTYRIGHDFGPKERFDTVEEMNKLIHDVTEDVQRILKEEKHGKTVRTVSG